MPEENIVKQETASARPSAEGSAEEEWLPTKEATKLAGASARTLRRRADAGVIRRTSVHGIFGVETHYSKEDVIKFKEELRHGAQGFADAIAEAKIRVAQGRGAEAAGGDKGGQFLAEANKSLDRSITKLSEPFFKLVDTLERGFDRFLHLQEQAASSQDRMIEIEINRDRQRREKREEAKKSAKIKKVKGFILLFLIVCLFGFVTWLGYHSYKRLTNYYNERYNELSGHYKDRLSLKKKETNALGWAYGQALLKHEKKVGELEDKIEELETQASTQKGGRSGKR